MADTLAWLGWALALVAGLAAWWYGNAARHWKQQAAEWRETAEGWHAEYDAAVGARQEVAP